MSQKVVMVHGAFCGAWAFDDFKTPFLDAGFDVDAIDLPGHGKGQDRMMLGRVSMSDYARAVAEVCAACETAPVLIGHSLGGLVVQLAAARAKVAALVLIAPSAPWGVVGSTMEEAVSATAVMGMSPFWSTSVEPDYTLARNYSLNRFASPARRTVFSRMGPESGRALWETLNWWLDPFMTTSVPANGIDAPVLALAGGTDLIHPAITVRQTAARLSGDTIVFDQMSHWLIGEPGWEEVAKACIGWIEHRA